MAQSTTGWSNSGKLHPGSTKGVKLQKKFPEENVYTIQFAVTGLATGAIPNIVADIRWTVAGNFVKRRVSVLNGMALTGTAGAVDVVVRDASLSPSAREYTVTIMVARGARGESMQPPIYSPIITASGGAQGIGSIIVAPSSVETFTPPLDIGVISMFTTAAWNDLQDPTPINNSDLVVRQFSPSALRQYDARNAIWVPTIPNLTDLNFANNTAAPAGGAVFSVAFGIEG